MKRAASISASLATAVALVVLFAVLLHGKDLPVLHPAGQVADAQRNLFIFTVSLSAIVVLPVFALLTYICIKFREGNTKSRYRPEWGDNRTLEAVWWGIPVLIIGVLAVVTIQTSHSLDPYKQVSAGKPLDIQVVALRWKWLFLYPEQHVATLNYIYLPNDTPVRFSLTADAPMSAFWIPSLGSQIYAMNGMQSELNLKGNRKGTYTGYTTNINGEGYAKMTFAAHVVSGTDFKAWATRKKTTTEMTMARYDQLAKPASLTSQRTYDYTDDSLFADIVAKNGHSHTMKGHTTEDRS